MTGSCRRKDVVAPKGDSSQESGVRSQESGVRRKRITDDGARKEFRSPFPV